MSAIYLTNVARFNSNCGRHARAPSEGIFSGGVASCPPFAFPNCGRHARAPGNTKFEKPEQIVVHPRGRRVREIGDRARDQVGVLVRLR